MSESQLPVGNSKDIQPSGAPAAPHARGGNAWVIALPLLALILVIGVPVAYVIISWSNQLRTGPGRAADSVAHYFSDAVRPQIDVHTIVMSTLTDVKKTNKLVVAQPVGNIDVTRDDSYASMGVYWGTNRVRIIAHDTKAQFVIDLSRLQTSDFILNGKTLQVTLPQPHIDVDMVSIDPSKIETVDSRGGWARFDKEETKKMAIAELKPRLIMQADTPLTRRLANEAGIEAMQNLLRPLALELAKEDIDIKVTYRDPA